MTAPHDPTPVPWRAGLGPAECVTCGGPCLAAPGIERPHCDACRRARVELTTAAPMPILSPAVRVDFLHRASVRAHLIGEAPNEPIPRIKIIERVIEIDASGDDPRIFLAARRVARTATEYGRQAKLTYALAHDMTKDIDIHSLCVRLWTAEGQRFGYASYINGRFSSAVLWRAAEGGPRLARGIDEFAHLALGQEWQPPAPAVVGPCYVCHRQVRWTKDAKPYRHKAEDGSPCWAGQEPRLQSS